jgi:hypothetical protein
MIDYTAEDFTAGRCASTSSSTAWATSRRADLLAVTGLIEAGTLTPVLDPMDPLAGTAGRLRNVEAGHARGKAIGAVT